MGLDAALGIWERAARWANLGESELVITAAEAVFWRLFGEFMDSPI